MEDVTYQKLSQSTEVTSGNLTDGHHIAGFIGNINVKFLLSTLWTYILAKIDTLGFIKSSGAQTITGVRLNSPRLNSTTIIDSSVTGTQINYLYGLQSNAQEQINNLNAEINDTNIQVNGLEDLIAGIASPTFVATSEFSAGASSLSILASSLVPDVSDVDPSKVIVQVYIVNGTMSTLDSHVGIQINASALNTLHSISLSGLETGKQYSLRVLSNG